MSLELKNMSFKAESELKVTGVPSSDACGFIINIGHADDNIALHFNPRFDCHGDHRVIVCNSLEGGSWMEEQRDDSFPFEQGEEFKVSISFDNDSFRIKLPGDHVIHFPNRLGDDKYKYVNVQGDVKIKGFKMK